MWRYVVSKIINWWYWLAIFGFIFMVGSSAQAYYQKNDENLYHGLGDIWDNYQVQTWTPIFDKISGVNFYTTYTSSSFSGTLYFCKGHNISSTTIATNCNCTNNQLILATTTANFSGWWHKNLVNGQSYMSVQAGQPYYFCISSANIFLARDVDTRYSRGTGFSSVYQNFDYSFYTDIWVPADQSLVTFLNPTDNYPLNIYNYSAPITSPQYFDWNIDYTISSSTITSWPSDIPQILIQYVNATSSVVNTVTMANTDLRFSFYTPGEIYNVTSNDLTDFPTQTGVYTAEVDLWRTHLISGNRYYDDILASSTIQFFIATSTPITSNTAWCNNLCSDLDLGTATTSSFWSGLVPNLLNNGICAIRYGACYLFWPDSTVIGQLNNTYNNFKVSFPFNVYYDLASTTQNALATSTNMKGTFKMPFVTNAGKATTITVLSSSSVPNLIGQTNSNLFRTTMGYLIWLITAGAIAFMAFTIL